MRTMSLAAVLIVLLCTPAAGIECRSSRGHDGKYWAWRAIDGKRCWYAGARGLSKTRLHWPARRALAKVKPPARVPSSRPADNDATMLESVWPALPPADDFAARWNGDHR